MRILSDQTCAIVVDCQEKLIPAMNGREELVERLKILLAGLSALKIPMVVTEQYRRGLGLTVPELDPILQGVQRFEKISFSCLEVEQLKKQVAQLGKPNVIVCGTETHVCVLQTVLDLIADGYKPVVAADCVGSRTALDKSTALERMREEGAIITTSESILFELTRRAGTDEFKIISKLVK
ncbi:MAG: hydrolase [Oscillospiraceae bacterium]|nr:hydrolase [Oscillospiraceae bacterium]